jgi:hypothetical protein
MAQFDRRIHLGVWKYINWAVYGIMLLFMYMSLINRYKASVEALITISFGWIVFIFLTYYIFVIRLNRVVKKNKA